MPVRMEDLGPTAHAAGARLALARFGAKYSQVDPAIITALAMFAIELIRDCIAARKADREPDPTPASLSRAAARIESARWFKPFTWVALNARSQMESVAYRVGNLGMPPAVAVELALREVQRADTVEMRQLISEAKGDH